MTGADTPAPSDDDGLRRNSLLVAGGVLASRVSGLAREAVTAALLGTGVGADAFRAALRIPNLLQNLLGEGVLSAAFIPAYSRALAEGRDEDAGRLAGAVASLLVLLTASLVVVGVVFAGGITRVLAPGFVPGTERYELTVTLVRILTPGVGFLVLSAWCLGILNSHRRFFLAYVAPVVWNVAILTAVGATALLVSSAELTLARALAYGALVGSVLQVAVQVPAVRRLEPHLRPSLSLAVPGLQDVLRRFGQVVAGRGSVQLGAYVDLMIASLLSAGALAALGYAQVLYLLPVSLFGMSVAAAELPTLSTMDHTDRPRVVARLEAGLGRVAFFVLPTTVAFVVAGHLVVATLYQGARFTADDAAQVGVVLGVYALGLLASTSSRLLQSSLYGVGDARTPAIYAAMRVVVGAAVALAVMFPLDAVQVTRDGFELVGDIAWAPAAEAARTSPDSLLRLGAAGLAFGSAVGAWLEYGLLRIRVRVLFGSTRLGGTHGRPLAVATLVALAAALAVRELIGGLTLHPRLAGLAAMAVIGGVYVAVARALGVPEARELLSRVVPRRDG